MIWLIIIIYKKRLREIKRQYLRRINFYLKQKEGLYEKKRPYSKVPYLYGVNFFLVCVMFGCCVVLRNLVPASGVVNEYFMSEYQIQEAHQVEAKRNQIVGALQQYASHNQQTYTQQKTYLLAPYLYEDALSLNNQPDYMKVYTYYSCKDANSSFKDMTDELKLNPVNINNAYEYIKTDQFIIIKDGGSIIKIDTIDSSLSNEQIISLLNQLGYTIQ